MQQVDLQLEVATNRHENEVLSRGFHSNLQNSRFLDNNSFLQISHEKNHLRIFKTVHLENKHIHCKYIVCADSTVYHHPPPANYEGVSITEFTLKMILPSAQKCAMLFMCHLTCLPLETAVRLPSPLQFACCCGNAGGW